MAYDTTTHELMTDTPYRPSPEDPASTAVAGQAVPPPSAKRQVGHALAAAGERRNATPERPHGRAWQTTAAAWRWLPEGLRDAILPTVEPIKPVELEANRRELASWMERALERADALPDKDDTLENELEDVEALLDAERDRRSSVEARLTTILGLTSVAASIAFGALTALFGRGFVGVPKLSAVLAVMILGYCFVQLVCAIWAAIRGVSRADYRSMHAAEVLPQSGETRSARNRRVIKAYVGAIEQHREANNVKVTRMAVAHVALRNFVFGSLGLTLLLGASMVFGGSPESIEARVVRSIRADSALIETLRGPRGAAGPRGAQGEIGPTGPSGTPGLTSPAKNPKTDSAPRTP